MWGVGITTAPRRVPTLANTVQSARDAGFETCVVSSDDCCEPLSGVSWHVHEPQGVAANWLYCLKRVLADHHPEFVLMLQDDVVLCRNVRDYLDAKPPDTLTSLYCSAKWRKMEPENGRIRLTRKNIWGCCALAMPYSIGAEILLHGFARRWRHSKNLDWMLGNLFSKLNREVYALKPGLAQHVGNVSSLPGHAAAIGNRKSDCFVGEHFDARTLLQA